MDDKRGLGAPKVRPVHLLFSVPVARENLEENKEFALI